MSDNLLVELYILHSSGRTERISSIFNHNKVLLCEKLSDLKNRGILSLQNSKQRLKHNVKTSNLELVLASQVQNLFQFIFRPCLPF